MQVDWISAFCESQAWPKTGYRPYDTGKVLRIAPGGEVELEHSRGLTLGGSYDNRLLVQSRTGADLYISGNPVKHIQGHNLFGPDDPVELFHDAGWEVRKALGLFPSASTWAAGEFTGPRFTRIDLTRSYRFASSAAARAWLRDVASTARTRHGGPLCREGTVTFGEGSEYWRVIVYHKGDEVLSPKKGHAIPANVPQREKLVEWAQGVVRFELRLYAKELVALHTRRMLFGKLGAPISLKRSLWRPVELWQEYYNRIQWNQNSRMLEADMFDIELPTELRRTLALWRAGADLRALTSRMTFYRHRRALLDAVGVDIATPPAARPAATIAPAELHQDGWDPEPLDGCAWQSDRQKHLV